MQADSTKIPRVCQHSLCGKTFFVYPSVVKLGHGNYCSPRCAIDARHAATYTQRQCENPSCGKKFSAWNKAIERGEGRHCSMDCVRAARYGATLAERFWRKVDKDGPTPAHCPERGPCWLWNGCRDINGYAKIAVPGRRNPIHATHVALLLDGRPVGEGQDACHHCDNPPCVRASHLFPDTKSGNMRDASRKGRLATGARHPSNTHPESLPRGEAHRNSKLTEAGVRELRSPEAKDDAVLAVIAIRLGIPIKHARAVRRGYCWKHVT